MPLNTSAIFTRREALKLGVATATALVSCSGSRTGSGKFSAHDADAGDFPFLIIRLHPQHHRNAAMRAEMLELLTSHPGVCDEVWFCTEFGFPDLQHHRESAVVMARAADEIRKIGIAPGLQIANTIGHGGTAENVFMASGNQRMIGHDGVMAPSCNCPRNREFLEYQRQLADIYAAAVQPSSVWIDDDLRMNSHPPIQYGCFCGQCLADFSLLQNRFWSRQELVAELVRPDQYSHLRQEWVEFSMSSLAEVAQVIAEATAKQAPHCRMGLQQCSLDWTTYYGPDLQQIFSAMVKVCGRKPGSRLGHGYYTDHAPRLLLNKSFAIARQVERAGDSLGQICPEVENTLHTAMGKSPRGTAIEATLDLAMGCNSLSFALWNDFRVEGPEWMALFLEKFKTWRPLWRLIAAFNSNSSLGGLDLAFGRRHAARPISKTEKPWDSWTVHFDQLMQISTLGLPLCPDSPLACAAVLTAEAVSGMSDEELQRLFSGGVLLDGEAAVKLQERKPGFDLGMSAEWIRNSGAYEILTSDSLNGPYQGMRWNQFDDAYVQLSFSGTRYRALGKMYSSAAGDGLTGCATAVFETEWGGRVGVLGFNGFQNIVSSAKRVQVLKMANWITQGRLPAILETNAQVVVCPRLDKSTGVLTCVTLLNASIGETQPLVVRLRHAQSDRVTQYSAEGTWQSHLEAHRAGTDLVVTVPPLSPWGIVFLVIT